MACGLPVATSNIADIAEVVGDAAVRVDPTTVSDIAEAIVNVLRSNQLRQHLIQARLARSKLF
jgi:glycosyltransferase involved in cell wall biosynthesis